MSTSHVYRQSSAPTGVGLGALWVDTSAATFTLYRLTLAGWTEVGGGAFSGDAGDVPFTPAGTIAATDVQAAIEEVASEATHPNLATHDALGLATDAELAAHAGAADPHPGYTTAAELAAFAQPLDADLTAIAALATTAYGRSLLEAANAAALRTLAGTVIGTDVQAYDADLAAIAALVSAADKMPYSTGAQAWALTALTAFGRSLVDDADAATARATLGLAALAVLATVGTTQIDNDAVTYAKIQNVSATDKVLGRSTAGAGDVEEIAMTAAGRALIDDADAAAQRTTLGLGTAATEASTAFEASGAVSTHAGLADPHAGYRLESASIGTTDIADDAVTYAKMQNVSATDKVLGRVTAGAGDVEEIAMTAAGRALIDDVDAAAQRTTLGLGTAATTASTAYEASGAVATHAGLTDPHTGYMLESLLDAKGDVIAASGDNVPVRVAVGANGEVLTADSAQAAGVKWAAVSAGAHTHAQADLTDFETGDSPQLAGLNVGHATDTTITRLSAGTLGVEGNELYRAGGTDVPVADGGTGGSTEAAARANLGLYSGSIGPSGWLAESWGRAYGGGNNNTLVGGTLFMNAIWLPKGLSITNLCVLSGTTAAVAPTHQWFALFDSSRVKLAITGDDTSAAWAASTIKALAITGGPFVTTYTGVHYIGVLVTVTTTLPSMWTQNSATTATALAPILAGASDAGLTTPATCPATAAAITANARYCYVGVS